MSPETIPWLLCGAFCVLPFLVGTGSFYAMRIFAKRNPIKTVARYEKNGRLYVSTEWSMASREEQQVHVQAKEEKE